MFYYLNLLIILNIVFDRKLFKLVLLYFIIEKFNLFNNDLKNKKNGK